LSLSYYLQQHKREHMVLEKADRPGEAWRNHRWDTFTLVTPNWTFRLPGAEYTGSDPDGFMPRDEIVERFERYVEDYRLPVQYGVSVSAVEAEDDRSYRLSTHQGALHACNVVVATGLYQNGKVPSYASAIPADIFQLHSDKYRNPQALPAGAVLVVGSGQSGSQIAEELHQSGREVYLSVGSAGRVPRRYRGQDMVKWLYQCGFFDRTPDKLPSLQARFAGNPQLSGKDGGHSLNLHQFSRDGIHLLGRLVDVQDSKLLLAPDLKMNLAKVDKIEAELVKMVDDYILKNNIQVPPEQLPVLQDGYAVPEKPSLNIHAAGISSVIWACGYRFNFDIVRLPVFDDHGFPLTQRGVTRYPGLYFLGMPWLNTMKSGLLMGVGEDAVFLAEQITRY